MDKMCSPSDLALFIQDREVVTSSDVINRMRSQGISHANARKIISRQSTDKSRYWRTEHLKLARNERLICKADFFGKPQFLSAVAEKLKACGRNGMARCIHQLLINKSLHRYDAIRLLAATPEIICRQIGDVSRSFEKELEGIQELGLDVVGRDGAHEVITMPGKANDPIQDYEKRYRNEFLLTRILVERMRQQNIVAWNQYKIGTPAEPIVPFNRQVFSAYGYSYLSPLIRWKQGEDRPTSVPVVFECQNGRCGIDRAESFSQRIDRAANRGRRSQKILGVIAARDFDEDAWDLCRKCGFIAINLRQYFGMEAIKAIESADECISQLNGAFGSPNQIQDFEKFASGIDQIKNNPIVVNLRSIGFEVLCGFILRSDGYEQVELGRNVEWSGRHRDVDVLGMRGNELKIIECKAYHNKKSLDPGDVKKFFTETVPICKKWLRNQKREFSKCIAELWTTGAKGDEANTVFNSLQKSSGDEWNICRIKEIQRIMPIAIRKRAMSLLVSIATSEIDGTSSSR